jgi:predicted AlkP superfamily pyrophosphatase or phosphodiesterase
MLRFAGNIYLFCLLLIIAVSGWCEEPRTILIVSIDALHPSALESSKIPVIRQLMEEGAYTLKGVSTDPPLTLISHTAMLTGLSPEESGKTDNEWSPDNSGISQPTLFDDAKAAGFSTGYFFSKSKLGFLVNAAVDAHELSPDSASYLAEAFIKEKERSFVFLHVSGLDSVGPKYGWLSPEYLEELSFIDDMLGSLIQTVKKRKNYLLIITSDHGGHGKIHGSRDPEDFKLPLIVCSNGKKVRHISNSTYHVKDLRKLVAAFLKE